LELYELYFSLTKDKIIKNINRLHEPVDGMSSLETVNKRKQIAIDLLDIELFVLL
jgi:hypothetical protein